MANHQAADGRVRVAMLLDNHHAPDPRVAMESRLLIDAGLEVRVVAWDRRAGAADATLRVSGAEVIRIAVAAPQGGGLASLRRLFTFAARVLRCRNALFNGSDVLVVHDLYLLPLGWALSAILGLPLVYDAHEDWAVMEAERYPSLVLRVVRSLETILARRARVVVVPGTSRVARWRDTGFRRPIVLRNIGEALDALPHDGALDARWDIAYCGTIASVRRLDILLNVAQSNPDLSIVIAGRGRGAKTVEAAAESLRNVTYLGWVDDAAQIARASAAIYYGLDPRHPYAPLACPNTLYLALGVRRPLIFFCGGEPERLASTYRIGVRVAADEFAVADAIRTVRGEDEWDFEPALRSVIKSHEAAAYVASIRRL